MVDVTTSGDLEVFQERFQTDGAVQHPVFISQEEAAGVTETAQKAGLPQRF